jgi:hypothetical protein
VLQGSTKTDFSLIAGGPLYQLFLRTRLARAPLGLLHRRALALPMIAWLPVAVLAGLTGQLLPGSSDVPFLSDVECHVRLLVALPLLLVAELPVHERLRGVLRQFIERNYIPAAERPKFDAAVASAMRLRNSTMLEVAILVLTCTAGLWLWRSQIAYEGSTWYAVSDGSTFKLTLAGYWYAFVSIPLFQFIGYRWYVRLLIWFHLLWQISRLRLHLIATHPDRSSGLGFVGNSVFAFIPLLIAHGALIAGWIADRVFQHHDSALDFQVQAFILIVCIVAAMLGPLCVFTSPIIAAKRRGRREYGLLAAQYAQAFECKWIHGERPADEPMLGSADMQSLADLGNSYTMVQETRLVPFSFKHISQVAIITAAPLLPLAFTVVPLRSMIAQSLKILF